MDVAQVVDGVHGCRWYVAIIRTQRGRGTARPPLLGTPQSASRSRNRLRQTLCSETARPEPDRHAPTGALILRLVTFLGCDPEELGPFISYFDADSICSHHAQHQDRCSLMHELVHELGGPHAVSRLQVVEGWV